jgi:hypothetical protein
VQDDADVYRDHRARYFQIDALEMAVPDMTLGWCMHLNSSIKATVSDVTCYGVENMSLVDLLGCNEMNGYVLYFLI